jgi:hypothetical protein
MLLGSCKRRHPGTVPGAGRDGAGGGVVTRNEVRMVAAGRRALRLWGRLDVNDPSWSLPLIDAFLALDRALVHASGKGQCAACRKLLRAWEKSGLVGNPAAPDDVQDALYAMKLWSEGR